MDNNDTISKRIIFFYPYSNLSTNPSMIALMEELSPYFDIQIFVPEITDETYPELTLLTNIKVCPNSHLLDWNRQPTKPPPKTLYRRLRNELKRHVPEKCYRFLRSTKSEHKPKKTIHAIIGVDPPGIAAAHKFQKTEKAPLIYLSFEILCKDEITTHFDQQLKIQEEKALDNCDFVIIQDKLRAELFSNNFENQNTSFEYLPVSPRYMEVKKTDFIRERLNIGKDMKIVLYQGSLANWSGRYEWEAMVDSWPLNTILVIHSRNKLDLRTEKFFRRMSKHERIFVTNFPLTNEELPLLTASADIGLASYHPSPESWYSLDNLKQLGLASGKLSYYLMCGLPILTNNRTSLANLVLEHAIGNVFDNPQSSGACISDILSRHSILSRNARHFYSTTLDPMLYIPKIVSRVMEIGNHSCPHSVVHKTQ